MKKHASAHILNVNSAVLQQAALLRSGVDHPGIPLAADGLPTGELKGPEAMGPAAGAVGLSRNFLGGDETGVRDFARLCVRAGLRRGGEGGLRLRWKAARASRSSPFAVRPTPLACCCWNRPRRTRSPTKR